MIFGATFERDLEKKRVVEEQTNRGRSQSTVNPHQDSSRSLKGHRSGYVLKKTDTYTHKGAARLNYY